ncbi:MAG: BON domain-containing protein, partial [Rhodopirellula bahusiensis]
LRSKRKSLVARSHSSAKLTRWPRNGSLSLLRLASVVFLKSTIRSRFACRAIADGVAGVVHVSNSLAVEAEPSGKTDEQITKDLNRKLKYTLLDRSDQIDVTVEDGVAILRGHVDT